MCCALGKPWQSTDAQGIVPGSQEHKARAPARETSLQAARHQPKGLLGPVRLFRLVSPSWCKESQYLASGGQPRGLSASQPPYLLPSPSSFPG